MRKGAKARPAPGDPTAATATDLAAAVRGRVVSAREVVAAYLERIAADNPIINAIVTPAPGPLAAADRIDREIAAGRDPGPLAGVPLTVKDSLATAGVRTTAASRTMAALVPRVSATAVARLEAAGAVLVGKTNTPEFALDIDTDNTLFGPTLNPRDARLTPGGSSGGESAALAAGFSALGLGTDFGASIRWPAQCTGVTGLRPTAGAVPSSGALPWFTADALLAPQPRLFLTETQVVAPMARSVADLTLALRVIAGPDGIDSTVHGALAPQRRASMPLRCAWFGGEGTYPVRADVQAAVAQAAETLAAAGLGAVHRRPDAITAAEAVYDRLRTADDAAWMLVLPVAAGGSRPPMVQAAIEASRRWSPADRARDLETRAELRASLLAFLEEHQILLCPVSSVPAFAAGATELDVAGEAVPRMGIVACCRAVGLFGLPAASVPYAVAADGAVISVQVVGRPFADLEVLAVAALLEHDLRGS